MSHYRSNLRDIEFNLFEVLGRGDVLGTGTYADLDADTVRALLAEVDHLAQDRAGGLPVDLGEGSLAEDVVAAEHLEEVELDVAEIALVVAHCSTFRSWVPGTSHNGYSPVT